MRTILAIDVGGTNIKYGIFKDDVLIHDSSMPTNISEEDFSVMKRLTTIINGIKEKFEITGIAISTAGVVDSDTGKIIFANQNLPNYTHTEVKKELEKKYHVPCSVENDVYSAAIGEMNHQSLDNFYMITVGTGVGGAYVKNRHVEKGDKYGAGRVSELIINQKRFEDIASAKHLIDKARAISKDEAMNGRDLFKCAKTDETYLDLIKDHCENIVEGLEMISLVVAPEFFLLGGGIMEQDVVLRSIFEEIIDRRTSESGLNRINIQFAKLGNLAGLYGAYHIHKEKYFIHDEIKNQIKHSLIVSCQALDDEPLHSPYIMAKMALAAKEGGAKGIRAQGVSDIIEIKKEVDLPVIGIIKKDYEDSEVYITPTQKEVDELLTTGCEIIALDATQRVRPHGEKLEDLLKYIQSKGVLAMADCSTYQECVIAEDMGFDFISSTLFGYTDYSENVDGPNFKEMKKIIDNLDTPFIAEGKIHTPEQLKEAFDLGSFSAVVGGAITRPQDITKKFVDAL